MSSFFEADIWSHRGKLFRLVFFWVKDKALAEDLLQNVFEKAITNEKELANHPNPVGWLMRTLKNETLMHFRQSKRFEALDDMDQVMEIQTESNEVDAKMNMVMRFLQDLPEKQREIFQLREVEGLTYEEIGSYLELSQEQVKVNLHRARKRIRTRILELSQ